MTLLVRLLLLAAGVLLLRWLWRRLLRAVGGRVVVGSHRAETPAHRGTIKRDPQCGLYVDVELAVTERAGDEVLYFCSQDCRQSYRTRQRDVQGKTG